MSFPVTVGLTYGMEKLTETTQRRPLGTRGVLPDGRIFYYAQAGATALGAGDVVQTKVSPGASVHVAGLAVTGAATTGVTTLSVVVATTPATKDQYADGYVTIDTSPGQAMYRIKSHPAVASGGTVELKLDPNDPLREALTSGTTTVGLRENPYASVIAVPATTPTGAAVGVTPISVGVGAFFWAQTYGPAILNTDTAPVAGRNVVIPGASAGSVLAATTAAADVASQVIGYAQTAGAGADKYNLIFLTIRS